MNIKNLKDMFCEVLIDRINNTYYPEPDKQGADQYYLDLWHAQESIHKIDRAALELYMHEMINETVDDLIDKLKFKF